MITVKTTKDGKIIAYTCEKMIVCERFIELKYENENKRVIIPIHEIIEVDEVEDVLKGFDYNVLKLEMYNFNYVELYLNKGDEFISIRLDYKFTKEKFCKDLINQKDMVIISLVKFKEDFENYIISVEKEYKK
jgi:hypothetical protein